MSIGFGFLARIGHLYPSGGLCDFEIQAMAPEGVQFVTTRLPFSDTSIDSDRSLIADLELHASLVADARVDLIALNCTAAGVVSGPEQINERIRAATGIRAVTTIEAVLAACKVLQARRIALLTPYSDDVVAAEIAFFAERGIEVVSHASRPCRTPFEQAMLDPQTWVELASELPVAYDALLISCAGVRVSTVIEPIEQMVGRPVITSNAALLWHCLRTLGIEQRCAGYGCLMRR
ncbi:arylmalonate decarboxylase [Paraburkholderia dipogonis]|uniref:Arylmalonate decarboxylase n=1 Tax=Paraburkholderia dipogonis TaxID=1211383 RepID=A0A4Y8MSU8_9BURK|nr:aspartate/glutamate racemase family protein [Paraburkholderia dipogonis]TFE40468.1 arylmalonate decarboxylase [Paraburkholderia dipogonis]